jgi:NAD(P)-dependent dehydrogenase (short-subunit alcohol dehydrogenase family)
MSPLASNKVCVIIGTSPIGLAIARRLSLGRTLLLADHSNDSLAAAVEAFRADGHHVEGGKVDLSQYISVRSLANAAQLLGQVEVVVNVTAVLDEHPPARRIYEMELLGTANVIDAFYEVASPGTALVCIANIVGSMASLPPELETHLAMAPRDRLLEHKDIDLEGSEKVAQTLSKRGSQLRVQAAAQRWGTKGARVNSVSRGLISTPEVRKHLEGPKATRVKAVVEMTPSGRIGTPEDVAGVVAFLAGPEASFITGNDVLVDGGVVSARRWAAVADR